MYQKLQPCWGLPSECQNHKDDIVWGRESRGEISWSLPSSIPLPPTPIFPQSLLNQPGSQGAREPGKCSFHSETWEVLQTGKRPAHLASPKTCIFVYLHWLIDLYLKWTLNKQWLASFFIYFHLKNEWRKTTDNQTVMHLTVIYPARYVVRSLCTDISSFFLKCSLPSPLLLFLF